MLKLVKICGRQQLESVFSHLGPINHPMVHDIENVTIHTEDGRFPAITELKNTFPWSHKPTKRTLSLASQNFTPCFSKGSILILSCQLYVGGTHSKLQNKDFQPSDWGS
jgi:hypothetical protein